MRPRALMLTAAALCATFGGGALMWSSVVNSLLYFPTPTLDFAPADVGLRHEDLEIETGDGERLHGWWIPTQRPPAAAHVLYFHGNGGNISHRLSHARALAAAGLDVLLFDYRGYGRSTGAPSEAGTYRDARAARGALLARPGVGPGAVVYFGESLGGAVAIELAVEHPPAALVLQSAFQSVRAMARLHYPVIPSAIVPDAYPSLDRIPRVACPVLVVHGERDDIVPADHGRALFAAAREPRRLEIVRGAGHNDLLEVAGPEYARTIAGWIREVVAAPPALPRR